MTVNDLIVAAPWITFGAGLSAVCIRLLRSGRHIQTPAERSRRVAPVHCCTGAPSGPCMHVPAHTAQASPKGRFSTALKILRRSRRASIGGPPVRSPRCSTCPSVPASAPASLQGLTCPRQRPCGHEHQARYPASYTGTFREETRPCGTRFPAAFQPPAFASWAPCPARDFRPSYDRPTAPPAHTRACTADPDEVYTFRTRETRTGPGALCTPGTTVSASHRVVRGRRLPPLNGRSLAPWHNYPARDV